MFLLYHILIWSQQKMKAFSKKEPFPLFSCLFIFAYTPHV